MRQLTFFVLFLAWRSTESIRFFYYDGPRCEILTPLFGACLRHGYNLTLVPNDLGHRSQAEALAGFDSFSRLNAGGTCSEELEFFLCTIHAPYCVDVDGNVFGIPPCRELCERVRRGCKDKMARVVKWEDSYGGKLRCDRFPSQTETDLCMPASPLNAPPPPPSTPAPVQKIPTTMTATTAAAKGRVTTAKPQVVSTTPPPQRTSAPKPGPKGKCPKCPKVVRATYKNFIKGKYDFVIRGDVKKRVSSNDVWTYDFLLRQIYNQSKIDMTGSISKTVTLWTKSPSNSKCTCPKLRSGHHLLIAGHENAKEGQLSLNKRTLIAKWDENTEISVLKWFKRAARMFGAGASNFIPPLKKARNQLRKTVRKVE